MKDLISDRKLINTTMWILLVGVAFFGTMPLFVLIYYAFAIFMIMRTAQSQFPKRVKIWMIVAYLVLAVLQTEVLLLKVKLVPSKDVNYF